MFRRSLLLILLVFAAFQIAAQPRDVRQQGAELTAAFYEKRIDVVWVRMDPQMQAAMQSAEKLEAFRAQVEAGLGKETSVVAETDSSEQGYRIYQRRAKFDKFGGVVVVQWTLDAEGRVAGFFIRPEQGAAPTEAPSDRLDYRTQTVLRLPSDDELYVFWGGRSVPQNYHAAHASQRFALDLVMVRDGRSHTGAGRENTDYFCFGRPLLAPAAGTVVSIVEGVADNVPGQMNREQLTGNRVIIDHGHDEYSVMAHLKLGSVQVKPGDPVDAGDHIGDCGNSGNSSEPHLHYQLQAGPEFGTAIALPAQFVDYLADDQPVIRGEPVKGQRIRKAETAD